MQQGGTALLAYDEHGSSGGAAQRVFLQSLPAPPLMLMFGANEFSAALAAMASEVGSSARSAAAGRLRTVNSGAAQPARRP